MGARLRLKASKDISGYAAPVQRIFTAMKQYGLIVADNGSDMYISGTYDVRWNNDFVPGFFITKRRATSRWFNSNGNPHRFHRVRHRSSPHSPPT